MKTYFYLLLFLLSASGLQAQVTADFSANVPDFQCPPILTGFINTSTGDNLEYLWDFGDGSTSTEVNPIYPYLSGGFFNVCLTATNSVTMEFDSNCYGLEVQQGYGDTTLVDLVLCSGDQVLVNGIIFDENNPTGVIIYAGQNNCDSAFFYNLNFLPEVITHYEQHICDGESITVNGTVYDVATPNGEELFVDVNGCDSIVFVDLLLGLEIEGELSGDLSPGNSVLLEVSISNGSGNYIYSWTDAQGTELGTSASLTVTALGEYTAIVQDDIGCPGDFTFTVVESTDLQLQIGSAFTVICPGSGDGFLSIAVSNGLAPYDYSWDNGLPSSNSVSNLTAGTYCLTVTDAMANTATGCFDIIESTLDISADFPAIVCQDEGYIDITIDGNAPFSFFWSNNSFAEDIDNLTPGSYSVTINDNQGCNFAYEYDLLGDFNYEFAVNGANCNVEDGAIIFTGDDIDNYQFNWSNGLMGDSIGDLAPGGYNVTISDVAGSCFIEETFFITEIDACTSVISGNIWNDTDMPDCVVDGIGGMPNVLVSLSNTTTGIEQGVFANTQGHYEFTVDEIGEYAISLEIANSEKFVGVCADPILTNVDVFDEVFPDNDFYLEYTEYEDVIVLMSKGNARPGFTQSVTIMVYNLGAVPATGELTFNYSPTQNYISANPAPANLNSGAQTMSWNYTNLIPAEFLKFRVNLLTPVGTDLGTLLNYSAFTNEPAGDAVPENNTANCELEVTGSYDPNDKQVTPMGIEEPGYIDESEDVLTYTVRFQNTGTDTAFTVVIRDTLDPSLDVASLQPLAASHAYRAEMPTMNSVEFIFDNILLPDSFINEPASNGYVTFSIRLKEDLPMGTEINNRAAIYFDFNEPIITNTVLNTIGVPDAVDEIFNASIPLQIQPNPLREAARVLLDLESNRILDLEIYSIEGVLIKKLSSAELFAKGHHQLTFSLAEELPGVYILMASDKEGAVARKMMVKF